MSTNATLEIKGVRDWVAYCVYNATLFPVEPLMPGPIVRHLFVTEEIMRVLNGPWKDSTEAAEWGYARGIMDSFVTGGLISVARNKRRSRHSHSMGFLDPETRGIWDLRATQPRPGIRIIGQFAERDFLICLAWEKRNLLGGYMSWPWKDIMKICEHRWRLMFNAFAPLKGGDHHDYLTHIALS